MKLPVLLVAFNRPQTTKRVLDAIAEYYPDKLFVAVDGPREGKERDTEKVLAVRELAKEGVHAKRIIPIFRESNHGCRLGVPLAITDFFRQVEAGVILEDDCIPNTDFWAFMEYALNQFRNDERIGHINGNSFTLFPTRKASFYYSKISHVWGWGTWRRAWEKYSVKVQENEDAVKEVLKNVFPNAQFIQDWWLRHIIGAGSGEINTWDYQWTYTLWKEGQACVTPSQNLVVNIGFDEEATHTVDPNFPGARLEHGSLKPPYQPPPTRIVDSMLDLEVLRSQYRIEPPKPEKWSKRVKRKLKKFLGFVRG